MYSNKLKTFVNEIKEHNRNPLDTSVFEMLKETNSNPQNCIDAGQLFYRTRIITEKDSIGKSSDFKGFDAAGSFVPPRNKSKDFRANYRNIPYLYLASTKELAIHESKCGIHDRLSMATIRVNESLMLFDLRQVKSEIDKDRKPKDNLLIDLAHLFAKPVLTDDDLIDYIPTQFIAELIKNLDYDGIIYPSSFGKSKETDYCIVVFNFDKCEAICSEVIDISSHIHFKF